MSGVVMVNGEATMKITADTTIDTIRSLGEHWRSFHLGPCARCGCPSWQQPCPVCGFYPYGAKGYAEGAKWREANPPTFERFERWHDSHGNIFEAVMAQVKRLIPAGQASVAPQVARARTETEGWEWPTARELWDTFGPESDKDSRPKGTYLRIRHEDVPCPVEGCEGHEAGAPCIEWVPPRNRFDKGYRARPANGGHQERLRAAYDARRHELRPTE